MLQPTTSRVLNVLHSQLPFFPYWLQELNVSYERLVFGQKKLSRKFTFFLFPTFFNTDACL